jgi:hypothetical protein
MRLFFSDASLRVHHALPAKPRTFMSKIKLNRQLVLGFVCASSLGLSLGLGLGYALAAQPHMDATVGLLQSARAELAKATPNKGGHRERALGMIDQAISEVRADIAFAGG